MPGVLAMAGKGIAFDRLKVDFNGLAPLTVDSKTLGDVHFARFTNPKFLRDKIFQDDDDVFVAMAGMVFNFRHLQQQHGAKDYFDTVRTMYRKLGDTFFKTFNGEFAGVLYDKKRKRFVVFVNHTGSKPLYYYHAPGLFIVSSQLDVVTQALRSLGRPFNLDLFGAYCLLTYGYMLEERTLVTEIKRLRPGYFLTVEGDTLTETPYLRLEDTPELKESRDEIIEQIDARFKEAVCLQYDKDVEYGYEHVATVSGGLDSRMNFVVAYESGYTRQIALTFAQNDYLDEQIAKQITSDLKTEWLFYSLNHGHYLEPIFKHAVLANGGLALFPGSAHLLSAMRRINLETAGMLHMGQVGDAVLGSFLRSVEPRKAEVGWGVYSSHLLSRIAPDVQKIIDSYPTENEFLMYNRGCNGALNGNWTTYQVTEVTSPFLDPGFLAYCMRIPRAMRFHETIYTDWIQAKRPLAAKYMWEKIKAMVSDPPWVRKIKKYKWMAGIVLSGRWDQKSMNPFNDWYKTNPRLREFVDGYWNRHSHRLDSYPELKKDAAELFNVGPLMAKTQVMTLLEAIRLHFGVE